MGIVRMSSSATVNLDVDGDATSIGTDREHFSLLDDSTTIEDLLDENVSVEDEEEALAESFIQHAHASDVSTPVSAVDGQLSLRTCCAHNRA